MSVFHVPNGCTDVSDPDDILYTSYMSIELSSYENNIVYLNFLLVLTLSLMVGP